MRIDVITIFPKLFKPFLGESLLKKAQEKGILKIKIHQLRDFTKDKHKTVDDKPFGGGRGMVFKIEPIYEALRQIKKSVSRKKQPLKSRIILFSPRGKILNQKMAMKWAKLDQLIFICGRYEGVDERVAKYLADEVVSVGDFVLMGGELPAMFAIEVVARLLPGTIGKPKELKQRITPEKSFIEYPQYTRPEVFVIGKKKLRVPKVLLSGNHQKIAAWRKTQSKIIGE